MATLIAPAATDDDTALVALMAADGIRIALVVVFPELEFGCLIPPRFPAD